MNQNRFTYILTSTIIAGLLLIHNITFAQNRSFGIEMNFVRKATSQTLEQISSNVLKICNHTDKKQELILSISLPGKGWGIVGSADKKVIVEAGDSLFIPVRIIPNKRAKGNTNYITNAILSSNNVQIGFAIWSIRVEQKSMWHAYLPQKKIYFKHGSDTAIFEVNIHNKGNAEENLLLLLNSTPGVHIFDSSAEKEITSPISFNLPVSASKKYFFTVIKETKVVLPTDKNSNNNENAIKYAVKVSVKDQNTKKKGAKLWNGNVDLVKLKNEYELHENGYNSLPVAIELNTFDLMSRNAYSTIDIYGHTILPKQRMLTYYFQSPFNTNYFNATSYLGRYHFLGFEGPKLSLGIGSVSSGKSISTMSGNGIRAAYRIGKHEIGGIFLKSPKFFNDNYLTGYGASYSFLSKNFLADNYFQRKENRYQKINTNTYTSMMNFKVRNKHNFRIGLGYSTENHYWDPTNELSLPGFHYRLFYSTHINKFRFSLINYYGSKNFSEYRGIFTTSFNSIYQFNNTQSISFGGTHMESNPEIFREGQKLIADFYTRRDLLSFKYMINKSTYVVMFNPFVEYYDYMQLKSFSKKFGIDYKLRGNSALKFYITAIGGYVKALDYDIPNFFVANLRTSIRYKQLNANIRYYYGPYFTREQLDFIENEINPQRVYLSLYYDYWFNQNKCLIKFNGNYNFGSLYKRGLLSTRPELFYYTKNNFRLSIYSRFLLYSENPDQRMIKEFDENLGEPEINTKFEIGFGIKKEFGFPISFKKYNDLKVVVFKDFNANGKQDKDEPGIQDMLITIVELDSNNLDFDYELTVEHSPDKKELITNRKGEVSFNNLGGKDYVIKTTPLSSQGGWFDGRKVSTILDRDKTVYIPLSKGSKLSGSLFVDREEFSHFGDKINLANIRVTAIDTAGKNHSTLTDADGNFSFFLPSGKYTISVNEAALGDRFMFQQNNIPIFLTNDIDNYSISFFVVEKRRKIIIKKFDKTGSVIQKEKNATNKNENNSGFEPIKKYEKEKPAPQAINGSDDFSGVNKTTPERNTTIIQKEFQTDPELNNEVNKIGSQVKSIESKVYNIESIVKDIQNEVSKIKQNPVQNPEATATAPATPPSSSPKIIKKNIVQIPQDKLGTIESDEFYVIIGAFKDPINALNAIDIYKNKHGFNTIIIYNEKRGWYYLCLENFYSFSNALSKYKELKKKNIDNWIYFLDQENNLEKYKR